MLICGATTAPNSPSARFVSADPARSPFTATGSSCVTRRAVCAVQWRQLSTVKSTSQMMFLIVPIEAPVILRTAHSALKVSLWL